MAKCWLGGEFAGQCICAERIVNVDEDKRPTTALILTISLFLRIDDRMNEASAGSAKTVLRKVIDGNNDETTPGTMLAW